MNKEKYVRLTPIYGEDNLNKIQNKKILIVGLGGVGGLITEALARTGFKTLDICDGDIVEYSNFNRQIIATEDNYHLPKVEAMEKRIHLIEPDIEVTKFNFFVDADTIEKIDFSKYDLIIDAIDDVNAKILLIQKTKEHNVEIICSMGTANKQNPNGFKIVDINQTSYCPLAKKMRVNLKKLGINHVKVCFSDEVPLKNDLHILASQMFIVGSASFVIVKEALNYLSSLD